ncbi:calcium-binding protein [Algirhabdus cladophorae]|uniref:calcium-binding protein n=1 Tax=Algirhabdus cladophorae TaxID=3377108 RepID=UPI003B84AFCF
MKYDATRFSTEFRLNTVTTSNQYGVELAELAGGGFVAVWTSQGHSVAGRSIVGQIFDDNGVAQGDEFIIQGEDSEQFQFPTVAGLADGGFSVFWASSSAIQGRRYDANGVELPTLVRQSGTDGDIDNPNILIYTSDVMGSGGISGRYLDDLDIIGTSDGGYTIGGHFYTGSNRLNDIGYYHYDADHPTGEWFGVGQFVQPNGTNIAANQGIRDLNQDQLAMASLSNGTMVSVWRNDSIGDAQIYARIVDSDSARTPTTITNAFQVNTSLAGDPTDPEVTALKGGGFVVTWHVLNDTNLDFVDVKSQLFSASGQAVGPEVTVNTITASSQAFAKVAALADGGYVVTWQSFEVFGNSWGVYARRFDSQGEPLDTNFFGGQFKVDSYANRSQTGPDVAATQDGGFTIAWTSEIQDGSGTGIFGQRYLAEFHGSRLADTLVDTGSDRLFGHNGDDVISGLSGSDFIEGGIGKDLIRGGSGRDEIYGGVGADTLIGGKGRDKISGGSGDDVIDGGKGFDKLKGGAGADQFLFSDGGDLIRDFGVAEDSIVANSADVTAAFDSGDTILTNTASGFSLVLENLTVDVDQLIFV